MSLLIVVGVAYLTFVLGFFVAALMAAAKGHPHDECPECVRRELASYFQGYEARKREGVR